MFSPDLWNKSSAAAAYTIDNSLRFDDGDSAYLSRTMVTPTNNKKWTFSWWFKRGNFPQGQFLSANGGQVYMKSTDQLSFYSGSERMLTTQLFRDPSAWYHCVFSMDTTQAAFADQMKLYVNGSQVTFFDTSAAVTQDSASLINSAVAHYIGQYDGGGEYWDGYLAEVYFIDGSVLDDDDFGELDSDTNQWIPLDSDDVKAAVTFGTNGFYQKYGSTEANTVFDDSSSSDHTLTANGSAANTRLQRKVGDSSIYINNGASNNLSTPNSSDFDFGTGDFTMEMWIRTTSTASQYLMGQIQVDGTNECMMRINATTNYFYFALTGDVISKDCVGTSAIPINTWTHVAAVRDDETLRVYVDGVQENTTDFGTQSQTTPTVTYYIGTTAYTVTGSGGPGAGYDGYYGYMDEIRISNTCRYPDGTTFTPNPDGAFTADSNTKLLIHSNWTGGLGADSSGNYNTFTPTNLDANDQMTGESPTNNFCTFNPLSVQQGGDDIALTEGNLSMVTTGSAAHAEARGTFLLPGGKWYFEFRLGGAGSGGNMIIGLDDVTVNQSGWYGNALAWALDFNGGAGLLMKSINGATTNNLSAWTVGNVYMVAVDMDGGKIWWGEEGTWLSSGDPAAGTNAAFTNVTGSNLVVVASSYLTSDKGMMNFGQDSSFAGDETAQGNQDDNSIGDFQYDVPAGFLAMCADNLPSPDIALPGENFNTVLYTGNGGGSTDAITGVGFQPDLNWIKGRTNATSNYLTDSVRGIAGSGLLSDSNAVSDGIERIASLDSDGFTTAGTLYSYLNTSSANYVAWNWKAGGAPTATNTEDPEAVPTSGSVMIDGVASTAALAGTIAATKISANTTAGFSIVEFTGDETTGSTVGHGLGQTPELIILKCPSVDKDWAVGSSAMSWTAGDFLTLNSNVGEGSNTSYWDTAPTPSVFEVNSHNSINNTNGMIAYCFASIEGYSKMGSTYVGNGEASDNTFIYTGFRPAYFWGKWVDGANDWWIQDNKRKGYNLTDWRLKMNAATAEENEYGVDLLSNGVKIRSNGGGIGTSGRTYLYMTFAESPFKYANAR